MQDDAAAVHSASFGNSGFYCSKLIWRKKKMREFHTLWSGVKIMKFLYRSSSSKLQWKQAFSETEYFSGDRCTVRSLGFTIFWQNSVKSTFIPNYVAIMYMNHANYLDSIIDLTKYHSNANELLFFTLWVQFFSRFQIHTTRFESFHIKIHPVGVNSLQWCCKGWIKWLPFSRQRSKCYRDKFIMGSRWTKTNDQIGQQIRKLKV